MSGRLPGIDAPLKEASGPLSFLGDRAPLGLNCQEILDSSNRGARASNRSDPQCEIPKGCNFLRNWGQLRLTNHYLALSR